MAFYEDDLVGMLRDFGVAATYRASAAITVIFDKPGSVQTIDGVMGIITEPQCHARTADVPSAAKNDTVRIGSTTYYVTQPFPDGAGMTRMILSENQV